MNSPQNLPVSSYFICFLKNWQSSGYKLEWNMCNSRHFSPTLPDGRKTQYFKSSCQHGKSFRKANQTALRKGLITKLELKYFGHTRARIIRGGKTNPDAWTNCRRDNCSYKFIPVMEGSAYKNLEKRDNSKGMMTAGSGTT